MQRLVDAVLGNAKESIKTFTQESFQNTVRVINGFSALVLALLPGKGNSLQGFDLYPALCAPRMPRWMEEGVSSFNSFISEYDTEDESGSESEYESGQEDCDSTAPPSPSSETSHISRASSSGKQQRRNRTLWQRSMQFLIWPLRSWRRGSRKQQEHSEFRRSNSGSLRGLARRLSGMKDYVVPVNIADRRRGIIEDLQLVMELSIERVFDVVRNGVNLVISPLKSLRKIIHWAFFRDGPPQEADSDAVIVEKATLGDSNPEPQKEIKQAPQQPLNTDGRTCKDIITSLGYPYEALHVTTADGHVLLLERIPRRNSQKVVFLQHGVFDSSLGWVSNGVVGSQAFAAFDQGYDVFLGNLRGLASREHVNKHISSQRYWKYSVNEHGTQDIPTMITKVHELKMSELKVPHVGDDKCETTSSISYNPKILPYTLCGVAHSLGGASMLIYVVTRRLDNKPHYLSRLILLSPAGFHEDAPMALKIAQYVIPFFAPVVSPFMPGIYIPTRLFRGLFNKLSRDFQNYPALGGLVQALLSYIIGGDSSNWVGAIGVSHYNMNDMPGVSYRVAVHLAQMMRAKRFIMYNFGSDDLNLQAYGTPYPLDIGANYGVIDIPVDIVAGLKDRLIPSSMMKKHYDTLKSAGCQASYAEFEFAHLDFTFANREELMAYVMSRLSLDSPDDSGLGLQPIEETPQSRSQTQKVTASQRKLIKRKPDLNGFHTGVA